MKITIIIYKRLFILFPNLITKESYNWWVTKRLWEFRHQISKAKYLKMSVAHIGKLQENTMALCKKWLQNSPGKRYRRIRICLTEEVETPSFPIRHQNSGCNTSGWNGGGSRIPDVRHPDGMAAAAEFQMWDIRVEVAAAGWNSFPGGMSYDSHPGGMSKIPYSLYSGFTYGKGLQNFGSSCFWAFHCFAMDSKELPSISDCFGDKKVIKTPKL